ncbi:MAG: sugar ABC transporter ATP-binding protein, partial [Clostridia bacterium]
IKILSGVYSLDSGEMELEGVPVKFHLPSEAKVAGIGIIHQELNYVATVSVAENIYMGDIPKKGFIVDYKRMYEGARKIMARIGVDIDPRMPIGRCTVAQKQLIEIAKVIAGDIKVLIMDEPTSALNDVETDNLFKFVERARDTGLAIIYISHKLDEIFRLADRVVVLRDGCVTGELQVEGATREQLIATMVGRKMDDMYPKTPARPQGAAIEVRALNTEQLKDLSFTAQKGEIFGVYGLLGSGHQDVGAAIFGQCILRSGEIYIGGKQVKIKCPLDALKNGIGYVPAERKVEGLVLPMSVRENMLSSYYAKNTRIIRTNRRTEDAVTRKWIEMLAIKTRTGETKAETLSGGNQQKVVLAKCLELEPEVLILNEPTRGIDVGAKAEIYRILDDLCKKGKCIIMITSEMPELLTMSDQIMVMYDGHASGYLTKAMATQENVLKYAIGG